MLWCISGNRLCAKPIPDTLKESDSIHELMSLKKIVLHTTWDSWRFRIRRPKMTLEFCQVNVQNSSASTNINLGNDIILLYYIYARCLGHDHLSDQFTLGIRCM